MATRVTLAAGLLAGLGLMANGCLLPPAPAEGVVVCDPAAPEPCPAGFFCRIGDTSGVPKCYRTSGGGFCGDGVVDPGEECDTEYLGTETCESRGYWGGHLACSAECRVVDIGCARFASVASNAATQGVTSALDQLGRIWSWGENADGQFGDGTLTSSAAPRMAAHSGRFVQVSVGATHSCALDDQQAPHCWGSNLFGQVGTGEAAATTDELPVIRPSEVTAAGPMMAIAAGGWHTCGIDTGGGIWCWGDNYYGQIGPEQESVVLQPVRIATTNTFSAISAGYKCTCALDTQGRAFCWGFNGNGQLGTGDYDDRSLPTPVAGGLTFASIATGVTHTCGLTTGGQIWCWGWDGQGALGQGGVVDLGRVEPAPVAVAVEGTFTSLSVGWHSTCAVDSAGRALCWGYGPTGTSGPGPITTPEVVSAGLGFTDVATNLFSACAVTTAGTPYCWGFTHDGRAGHSIVTSRPAPLLGQRHFPQLALGYLHTCGLDVQRRAWCWGNDRYYQVGSQYDQFPEPLAVTGFGALRSIHATAYSNCVLDSGGLGTCWGDNTYGQVGANTTDDLVANPTDLAGNHTFKALAGQAWGFHFCGVDTAGDVWCWGYNWYYQLGTTAVELSRAPRQVTLADAADAVAVGAYHSCALIGQGELWCWGSNLSGELGNGSTDEVSADPVLVAGSHVFTTVVAGDGFTCALDDAGLAWCWGGITGLGIGALGDRREPTRVASELRFRTLSAGNLTTCGIDEDSTLWCWGQGTEGQLGNGELTTYHVPVRVDIGSVVDVFVGGEHVCATTTAGATQCWGGNSRGQLGIDAYLETPTEIEQP